MTDTNRVKLVEVGPRDGLQNEPTEVATQTKVELIRQLSACGIATVEATSFVSPKWVPQMADAAEVLGALDFDANTQYPVLVPNEKGMQRAMESGAREIAVFTAASEAFNQRNINCSIDESLARFEPVMAMAQENDIRVRGYVSCVLGCPYQGEVPLDAVADVALRLSELGCYEISLGDTIGVGTPGKAANMLQRVATDLPMERLAVHFHDTYGQALANIHACLEAGVRVVDASVSGLGGCPYARGASGNVASEDVVYMLHGLGMTTGIDLPALARTGEWISDQLGRENQSKAGRAMSAADRE